MTVLVVVTLLSFYLIHLASSYLEALPPVDLVVPVPLHFTRLKSREFNQSFLLAEHIGRILKKPVFPYSLKKNRATLFQIKLNRMERQKNLKDSVSLDIQEHVPKDKSILLVDDVYTTGATVNACAKILKEGGGGPVRVFTLARTLPGEIHKRGTD